MRLNNIITTAVILIIITASFFIQKSFHPLKITMQTSNEQTAQDLSAALALPNNATQSPVVEKNIEKPAEKNPAVNNAPDKTGASPIKNIITDKKIIALTFDADMTAGMEYALKNGNIKSWYNEAVINELEKTETPATLFLTGLWIKNYPDKTRELAKNSLFEIANHSYSHSAFTLSCYKLPAIADDLDEKEITQTEDILKLYAPNYKKYFRFPGLCSDDFDILEVQRLGYQIIGGSISGLDGFNNDTKSIINRVVSHLAPGSIIILHMHGGPNAPKTAVALPEIIRQAKKNGYEFIKISELLDSEKFIPLPD